MQFIVFSKRNLYILLSETFDSMEAAIFKNKPRDAICKNTLYTNCVSYGYSDP